METLILTLLVLVIGLSVTKTVCERDIEHTRACLIKLRDETGKSFSVLATNAGMSPSTITRFMGQTSPQFTMKRSTLKAIVTAATDLQQVQEDYRIVESFRYP